MLDHEENDDDGDDGGDDDDDDGDDDEDDGEDDETKDAGPGAETRRRRTPEINLKKNKKNR